jgi:hypothetical protein
MPYYRITVHFSNGSGTKAIRFHESWDIDLVYRIFEKKIMEHYNPVLVDSFEVVMVPKNSGEVKGFIANQAKHLQGRYKKSRF